MQYIEKLRLVYVICKMLWNIILYDIIRNTIDNFFKNSQPNHNRIFVFSRAYIVPTEIETFTQYSTVLFWLSQICIIYKGDPLENVLDSFGFVLIYHPIFYTLIHKWNVLGIYRSPLKKIDIKGIKASCHSQCWCHINV